MLLYFYSIAYRFSFLIHRIGIRHLLQKIIGQSFETRVVIATNVYNYVLISILSYGNQTSIQFKSNLQ